MNTPLQEKLAQLEEMVNLLEQMRWGSKEADQLTAELIQAEINLMRAYPDLEQATNQAENKTC